MIPAFHEEWFCQESQDVLAGLVNDVKEIPGMILEIGAWEGRSTIALANAAHPRVVAAVDTWEGSPGEISSTLAGRRDVFTQWATNVAYWTRGNVVGHRMGWRDFTSHVKQPIALLFIDAEHTYTEVKDNLLAYLPLMAPGGIICGDDAHHPPILQALDEVLGTYTTDVTVWIHKVPA